MPRQPSGFARGRPHMQPVANVDDKPCCVCRIRLSKSWKAVACHPVPTKSFPFYDWFCSGPSSGGTESCRKKAKDRGAQTVIPLCEPRILYEIVGVKKNATLAQVKRAHKKRGWLNFFTRSVRTSLLPYVESSRSIAR